MAGIISTTLMEPLKIRSLVQRSGPLQRVLIPKHPPLSETHDNQSPTWATLARFTSYSKISGASNTLSQSKTGHEKKPAKVPKAPAIMI